MWDFLNKNAEGMYGLGGLLGGIGGAWGAYKEGKALDKQNELAEKNYNLNVDLLREERARRKKADESLNNGLMNSSYRI